MDFSEVIGAAWRLTWGRRELWLFGFFAGGASGTCNGGSSGVSGNQAQLERQATLGSVFGSQQLAQINEALPQVLPILVVLAALGLVIVGLLWLFSVACRAAVIAGAADPPPASAWQAGLRAYGRLLVLDLLVLVLWLLALALVGALVLGSISAQPLAEVNWLRLLALLGSTLGLVGLVGSVLGIGVAFAQRAIVLDGLGPLDGLRAGFGLLRQRLGSSLLVWLVGLVLQIGGTIALVIGVLLALIPIGIIALIIYVAGQGGVGIPLGVLLAILAGLVAAALLNTFLWHYWTLAYLRLSRPEPSPAAVAVAAD